MTACAMCGETLARPEAGLVCPTCFEREAAPKPGFFDRVGPGGAAALAVALVPSAASWRVTQSRTETVNGRVVHADSHGIDYVGAAFGPLGIALALVALALAPRAAGRGLRFGVATVALGLAIRATFFAFG